MRVLLYNTSDRNFVIGASHTPNAGGLGAIAIGVGGADAVYVELLVHIIHESLSADSKYLLLRTVTL